MVTKIRARGFTLIEMAIVIAIIGLIIGGIALGSAMITAGRLTSVVADVNRYKIAISAFRDKYHYLPGDFPNAQSVWPSANYGDGDGFIGGSTGTTLTIGTNYLEALWAWQHLSYAHFIEGQYTGAAASGNVYDPGANIPASKYPDTIFTLSYAAPAAAGAQWASNYRHVLSLGAPPPTVLNAAYYPGLLPKDAYAIDMKMDDGFPGTGNVITFDTTTPNCTTSSTAYATSYTSKACALMFLTGY